jgi:hypothetical protein
VRLAAAVLLAAAAGCAPPGTIKAYPGPDRSSDELAVVLTDMRNEEFSITDNEITSVDGVRYEKRGYTAQMLPGVHRIGVQGLLRTRMKPRLQYCSFDLNVDARCTCRPQIPAYPRSAYDLKPGEEWSLTRTMTVIAECTDTTFAIQVPIDCRSSP